jgi:hypothetical protein
MPRSAAVIVALLGMKGGEAKGAQRKGAKAPAAKAPSKKASGERRERRKGAGERASW